MSATASRTGSDRWSRVVLDSATDFFRPLSSCETVYQMECHVDPAEIPAEVTMSPSSTNRALGSTSMLGSSSASFIKDAQCVVAGRRASNPAAA